MIFAIRRRYRDRAWSLLVILFMAFSLCWGTRTGRADALQRELLLGIEPEHNIFDQVEKYRVLADYLSEQLGLKVRLTITSRYGELVDRFKSLHLDGAFLSSYTATVAMNELFLSPMASLEGEEHGQTSRGVIFIRKDSGIEEVEDMRGKRAVFVDPATTEGYVFARAYFRRHGVESLDSFFSQQDFSGSHASAVYSVLDGRADVGSAKNIVFNQLIDREPSIQHELRIFAESPPVPEVTLCVKSDLDPVVMEKLQFALLRMDQTVNGRRVLKQLEANRFIPSRPEDFSEVFKMAEEAGMKKQEQSNSL